MVAETEPVSLGLAEIRDLKMTVFALREELERSRRDTGEAVRQGVSGANAEIAQLEATIGALRDELQEWPIRRDEAARLAQAALKEAKPGSAAAPLRPVLASCDDVRVRSWAEPLLADARAAAAKALEAAEALASQDPVEAVEAFGVLAQEMGSEEESGKAATQKAAALKTSPAHEAELLFRKGMAYQQAGNSADFRVTMRAVIKKFPDTPAAGKAETALAQGAPK